MYVFMKVLVISYTLNCIVIIKFPICSCLYIQDSAHGHFVVVVVLLSPYVMSSTHTEVALQRQSKP